MFNNDVQFGATLDGQRSKASDANGLSDLDVFVLHVLVFRNGPLRASDLAFALSIEDLRQFTYSLRKLVRLDMMTSDKVGKKVSSPPEIRVEIATPVLSMTDKAVLNRQWGL